MMKKVEDYTYLVTETIGKGHSSTVHRGRNQKTGEEVSIKVIEMAKLQDPINRMLLQHEIQALKTLTYSRHVLHFYAIYATKNNTYVITELCEGDLAALLKRDKLLPYPQAVEVLRQLIIGYSDVYNTGYLHRDIKPANIFYRQGQFKLGDFGFAIPFQEISHHRNYNVGSPAYMSPEALKENAYSVSSDIWALGIVFFQMLKGFVPWKALSEQRLHQKILNEHIDSLTFGLPDIARSFFSEALSLNPNSRPTTQRMASWPSLLIGAQIRPIFKTQPESFRSSSIRPLTAKNLIQEQFQSLKQVNEPTKNLFLTKTDKSINHYTSEKALLEKKGNSMGRDLRIIEKGSITNAKGRMDSKEQLEEPILQSRNLIYYVKFIHRVLKFIKKPTQLELPQLQTALTNKLFLQLQALNQLSANSGADIFGLKGWSHFLPTFEGEEFGKQVQKYKKKYGMMHELGNGQVPILSEKLLREGIIKLMDYLQDQENFQEKMVIGADYLTTLVQLESIRARMGLAEFLRVSKIDLIMQGDPYNTNRKHLLQLRRKIKLIGL